MAVTKREDRKFKFETLQLHVGQEQPDPATEMQEQYLFTKLLHMCLKIVHMQQLVLN